MEKAENSTARGLEDLTSLEKEIDEISKQGKLKRANSDSCESPSKRPRCSSPTGHGDSQKVDQERYPMLAHRTWGTARCEPFSNNRNRTHHLFRWARSATPRPRRKYEGKDSRANTPTFPRSAESTHYFHQKGTSTKGKEAMMDSKRKDFVVGNTMISGMEGSVMKREES